MIISHDIYTHRMYVYTIYIHLYTHLCMIHTHTHARADTMEYFLTLEKAGNINEPGGY